MTISAICAAPVAPIGCPLALRPPDGFTGIAPPRQFCPACGERTWEAVRLSGEGAIESFTVIRVAPRAHAADAPYAIAVVKLTEGVSLLGRIVDISLEKIAIGVPVRFRPLVRGSQTAVGFGPA